MSKTMNPIESLRRFMMGIFDYYRDRGMHPHTAKARMYDESLDQCHKLYMQEKDIPDHILVISMQYASRMLNSRGIQLANQLKELNHPAQLAEIRQAVASIKATKDTIDHFISTYKGETADGKGSKRKESH